MSFSTQAKCCFANHRRNNKKNILASGLFGRMRAWQSLQKLYLCFGWRKRLCFLQSMSQTGKGNGVWLVWYREMLSKWCAPACSPKTHATCANQSTHVLQTLISYGFGSNAVVTNAEYYGKKLQVLDRSVVMLLVHRQTPTTFWALW